MTTNSKLAALQKQAADYNEVAEDMNEVVNGGGGVELRVGNHFCRLSQYIEVGSHSTEYEGTKKPSAPQFILGFTVYQIDRSDPKAPKILDPVLRRTRTLTLSRNEKATAHKLFKRLNYKGTAKNFGELLGEAFILPVKKEKLTKGQNAGKEVAREQWLEIQAAVDPVSGTAYNVPAIVDEHLKLFLFDLPNKEAWDELFIDGKKDDGASKNWIQDKIVSADNYAGSALEALLGGGGIPSLPGDVPEHETASSAVPAPANDIPSIPDIPAL